MRKIILPALVLMIIGLCFVVAVYYTRYQTAVTALERFEVRINDFDTRLAKLEAHKARNLTVVEFWGRISTTDTSPDRHMLFYESSVKHPEGFCEAINAKGGPLVRPEIRIPFGSTTNSFFEIHVESQFGTPIAAWLSHAEPYSGLAEFEELRIYCSNGTNVVRLAAQARTNASINTRFDLAILCEK